MPLVSCIMPTANRRQFVPAAIRMFLGQDYPEKELIVLDDGEDSVGDLMPDDPRIRYIRHGRRQSVGRKRNLACAEARGEIIAHWDDDDWYAPDRLSRQVAALESSGAAICGLDRVFFLDSSARRAWEYVYPEGGAPWVCGATLCYRKSAWQRHPFPEVNIGEDTRFVAGARDSPIVALPEREIFVGLIHRANTSPKYTHDPRWQPRPVETVEAIMGGGWATAPEMPVAAPDVRPDRPTALLSAAGGIGDILRTTPLIRVLDRLGYAVDLLLAPDEAATVDLLRGAPELRRVIHYPDFARNRGGRAIPELGGATYAVAAHTAWSAPLARWVKADRQLAFSRPDWLVEGDSASVARIARDLGWEGPLPEPFAITSGRRFGLPPGTIALHPGCKPNWPWKKWHGFADLARRLPHVAIVGTASDLDNSQTYFAQPFDWPDHVQDFTGKLSLADTAALIGQCAAIVANDSGLLHLGVALGVPSFGIFGITSPQREAMPSPLMIPISKGLACEAACRREAWGRRDCDHHLECLKMLTAEDVAEHIETRLPELRRHSPPAKAAAKPAPAEAIRLNYYGAPFDASGYGQAARLYIHALHAAGIKLSVIDTGARPAQVEDAEIARLLGEDPAADFNLFHGIPPFWARNAFRLRNVIAMTVWETDTMPQQWRNPLVHAIDVWLPCSFNIDVFSRGLGRAPFRLPHALPSGGYNGAHHPLAADPALGLAADDFVFYSIFEWQDRKNPTGLLEAFLRAFPEENDAVLAVKTSGAAASLAATALADLRARTGSRGRVVLACEGWEETKIAALQARGDCYVSLHKGEGWNYPLFEAACRGKPVVATAYAGPLDYLDEAHHWLVRCGTTPVRQRYAYYNSTMRWAEPDLGHAIEGLRWVHGNRVAARDRAAAAAAVLRSTYSQERIGAMAKARLAELLGRVNPPRLATIHREEREQHRPETFPIPGDWYDADYFEHGRKSNWLQGYRWTAFQGIFEAAAGYLVEMFPEARSVLDVGCAKGFLVRALRAKGMEAWGFDHSRWAIENAEAAAKPFLQIAEATTAEFDRRFDLVVAMHVLESLTEDQLAVLLPRMRLWSGQAMLAVIATADDPAAARTDGDLARITMQTREWWVERFRAAGWHRDAIHRRFERECRRHPLVQRMNWDVFVFTPGEGN